MAILICARVKLGIGSGVEGSVIKNCHKCNCQVHVAPSSVKMLAEPDADLQITCDACCAVLIHELDNEPIEVQPIAPAQFQELKKSIETLEAYRFN